MTAPPLALASLLDPDFHASGDPHAVWRWMRGHAPVEWNPPGEFPGFWSLTRYEDVRAVYRNPGVFSSASGVLLRLARAGVDPGGGQTLALTDPPRHKQLRGIIADWFDRRSIRLLEDTIRVAVAEPLAEVIEQGECDFVHDVAARFSHRVICGMLGVPAADQDDLLSWTDDAFGAPDPGARALAHHQVMEYFLELMYQRMIEPRDDIVSALVNGDVDGDPLTEYEILLSCENLIGATENGRLALIGAVLAFLEHPAEWRRLRADPTLTPRAVEEILRWTSSATHSMRTATEDTTIDGRRIRRGDRVVLWIPSANRDEKVFDDPYRFDVDRNPNRHLALGSGEHFCIGGLLARTETRILLTELLGRVDHLLPAGSVSRVRSIAVSGAERLPVRFVRA